MRFRHDGATAQAVEPAAPSGVVVERPPPGLARGRYPASPLSIVALGSLLVLGTLFYVFRRLRKLRS